MMNISCQKASELMSKDRDRGLSFIERIQLLFHTNVCEGCRLIQAQLKQLARLFDFCRDNSENPPEYSKTSLSNEARERMQRAINRQQP